MSDTTTAPAVKAGFKTSEFWLTLAATVVSVLYASGAIGESSTTGKALALLAGLLGSLGYTVSRTLVKNA